MVLFVILLATYAIACVWFFVLLVRWTVTSERTCSCRGSMAGGLVTFVHTPRVCYPVAESLTVMG